MATEVQVTLERELVVTPLASALGARVEGIDLLLAGVSCQTELLLSIMRPIPENLPKSWMTSVDSIERTMR